MPSSADATASPIAAGQLRSGARHASGPSRGIRWRTAAGARSRIGARSTAYQSSTSTTVIARSTVGTPSAEWVRSRGIPIGR